MKPLILVKGSRLHLMSKVLLLHDFGMKRQSIAHTESDAGERAGDDAVQEAFVIYKPTGQIIWALVDGGGQSEINIQIGGIPSICWAEPQNHKARRQRGQCKPLPVTRLAFRISSL